MRRFAIFLCATLSVACNNAHATPPESVMAIAGASAALFGYKLFQDDSAVEQHYVSLEGGRFDVVSRANEANEFGLEFRPGWTLWKFRPLIGVEGTTDESFYVYAGGRFDVYFGRRFVASPSFSLTYYHKGDGKDLGSEGVARSGIDFQYRFDNDMRLGARFYHMSHGKVMGNVNPGTETVGLTFSIPLGRFAGNR